MLKDLKTRWWGVTILLLLNFYVLGLYSEYIINREVWKEVQIIVTLGVLVMIVYSIKLVVNFIYNLLKEKEND